MVLDALVPEEAQLSDDRVLVAQSVQGDSAAFTQLLRRHDDKMRGVVWRLAQSRSEMDDILQDAYLKAWRGLADFRGDAAFSSWLYRIVYTTTLDHLKAVARRRIVPYTEASALSVDDASEQVADSFALAQALGTLPADQLAVISLVDGQGDSYDDVAELLGISPGTVGSRLSRARAHVRKQLHDTGAPRNNDAGGQQ